MTIYVDNAMIPAKVGRFDARWCHLVSDQIDPTELHEFAARIGLRRAWFQRGTRLGEHDPAGDHYDVTEGRAGAGFAPAPSRSTTTAASPTRAHAPRPSGPALARATPTRLAHRAAPPAPIDQLHLRQGPRDQHIPTSATG